MAYDILAQATVLALSLIFSVNCLDIDVQPEFVRPNDQNVVFTCSGGNDTTKMLERMLGIRLVKQDDDYQWTDLAVLRFDGVIILRPVDATAVGRVGDVSDSNLVVTWPVAPEHINGKYRCEALVLTNTGDVVKEQSRELDVRTGPNDLLLLLAQLRKSERRLVEKVNETMHRAMQSSKINLLSVLGSHFGDFKKYLDNRTAGTVSEIRPEEEVESMQWPEGKFNLLMPSAGCPLHPPAWIKSFTKIKEQLGDKYYPINTPLHLAKPHKKNGFIYRQYCMLPDTPERTQPWPKGRYCLPSTGKFCPTGFEYSQCRVKVQKDDGNFYKYYYPDTLPRGGEFKGSGYNFRFCCRHDGNASSPIDLPVSHPFYLLRHGGRCQEVKGMDVTQDTFLMETVGDDGYDKWYDQKTDFRPDVYLKPYKEDLCYYSRRTR